MEEYWESAAEAALAEVGLEASPAQLRSMARVLAMEARAAGDTAKGPVDDAERLTGTQWDAWPVPRKECSLPRGDLGEAPNHYACAFADGSWQVFVAPGELCSCGSDDDEHCTCYYADGNARDYQTARRVASRVLIEGILSGEIVVPMQGPGPQPPTDDEVAKLAGYGIEVGELGRAIITNSIAGVSSEVGEGVRFEDPRASAPVTLAGVTPPLAEERPGPKPDSYADTDGGTGARKVLAGEGELTMDGGSYRLKGTITGDPKLCPPEVKLQGASPERHWEQVLSTVRDLLKAGKTITQLEAVRDDERGIVSVRIAWEEEGD